MGRLTPQRGGLSTIRALDFIHHMSHSLGLPQLNSLFLGLSTLLHHQQTLCIIMKHQKRKIIILNTDLDAGSTSCNQRWTEDNGVAGGRTIDNTVEQRKADGMTVSISPSTSVSFLLLLCFFPLKAIVLFKPQKDAPAHFVYFLF